MLSPITINGSTLHGEFIDRQAGAFASFEGWVRDHNDGRSVTALEYEAFEPLCVKEAEKIFAEARQKFSISNARCVHRTGKLNVGDMAVWVGVTAAHRDDAFKACRYIIDEVKHRLPIWKKEYYQSGDSGWVNCEAEATACSGHQHVPEVPDETCSIYLTSLKKEDFGKYTFIDIRETVECVMNPADMECSRLPLSQWLQSGFDFTADRRYLVFCEKGMRSLNFVKELRKRGISNVHSVVYGVNAVKDFAQLQKI